MSAENISPINQSPTQRQPPPLEQSLQNQYQQFEQALALELQNIERQQQQQLPSIQLGSETDSSFQQFSPSFNVVESETGTPFDDPSELEMWSSDTSKSHLSEWSDPLLQIPLVYQYPPKTLETNRERINTFLQKNYNRVDENLNPRNVDRMFNIFLIHTLLDTLGLYNTNESNDIVWHFVAIYKNFKLYFCNFFQFVTKNYEQWIFGESDTSRRQSEHILRKILDAWSISVNDANELTRFIPTLLCALNDNQSMREKAFFSALESKNPEIESMIWSNLYDTGFYARPDAPRGTSATYIPDMCEIAISQCRRINQYQPIGNFLFATDMIEGKNTMTLEQMRRMGYDVDTTHPSSLLEDIAMTRDQLQTLDQTIMSGVIPIPYVTLANVAPFRVNTRSLQHFPLLLDLQWYNRHMFIIQPDIAAILNTSQRNATPESIVTAIQFLLDGNSNTVLDNVLLNTDDRNVLQSLWTRVAKAIEYNERDIQTLPTLPTLRVVFQNSNNSTWLIPYADQGRSYTRDTANMSAALAGNFTIHPQESTLDVGQLFASPIEIETTKRRQQQQINDPKSTIVDVGFQTLDSDPLKILNPIVEPDSSLQQQQQQQNQTIPHSFRIVSELPCSDIQVFNFLRQDTWEIRDTATNTKSVDPRPIDFLSTSFVFPRLVRQDTRSMEERWMVETELIYPDTYTIVGDSSGGGGGVESTPQDVGLNVEVSILIDPIWVYDPRAIIKRFSLVTWIQMLRNIERYNRQQSQRFERDYNLFLDRMRREGFSPNTFRLHVAGLWIPDDVSLFLDAPPQVTEWWQVFSKRNPVQDVDRVISIHGQELYYLVYVQREIFSTLVNNLIHNVVQKVNGSGGGGGDSLLSLEFAQQIHTQLDHMLRLYTLAPPEIESLYTLQFKETGKNILYPENLIVYIQSRKRQSSSSYIQQDENVILGPDPVRLATTLNSFEFFDHIRVSSNVVVIDKEILWTRYSKQLADIVERYIYWKYKLFNALEFIGNATLRNIVGTGLSSVGGENTRFSPISIDTRLLLEMQHAPTIDTLPERTLSMMQHYHL